MRASRLLSLLLLLQNRGRMTAARLAEELEVSERTIYRDVESLSSAGVPVYAERGTGGGYRLLEGYRTRLTGLTGSEADSLFLTGLPGAASELGLGAELAVAHLKLLAALPEGLRERAERVRSRFHLDAPAWWREPEPTPHLSGLATAVWEERTVDLAYRRWDGTHVRRRVDPLGLVLKAGAWYVLARPHTAAREPGVRVYRVGRVQDLTDTGAPFQRPDDFDLAATWRAWARDFEASRHTMRTRVRLTRTGLDMVRTLSSSTTAAGVADAEPGPDGWWEGELAMENVPHAVSELAGYGPEVEVLEPAELRRALVDHARATLALYEPEGRARPSSPGDSAVR